MSRYIEIMKTYGGSDGDATRRLYDELSRLGTAGFVAMNLFRAHKNSARAKVYRGGNKQGSYRAQAYERKAWAIRQLDEALVEHAAALGIIWGWKPDPKTIGFPHVLYVETPHGQVSFHSDVRGKGPEYPGEWDEARHVGHDRISRWCADLLMKAPA